MTQPGLAGSAPDFWDRTRRVWHMLFAGLLLVLTALVVGQDGLDPTDRAVALGCLSVIALAYALAGRRALGLGDTRLALLYLVPAWIALVVLVSVDPSGYVLLFMLFPQTWAMLPHTWQPVVWTLVAALVLAVTQLWQADFAASAAPDAALNFAFSAGLSLLLGLWITGIVRESDRRAELIDQLQRTRDELADAEHARGVMAERERLAREIHDTLAQGFTSVLGLAQAIEAGLDSDPDAVRERLALLEQTARENLAEARSLVAALTPVDLSDGNLPAALGRVVQRFSQESGVDAELVVRGDVVPLAARSEVVLLRSAQEALANVRKHAQASRVTVRLDYHDGTASLRMEDDGIGLGTAREGFGLRGMRDRAAEVGGQVRVGERPEGGTRIDVEL